ncbi:MAG: glycine betaine ABC transporter substrate-binding protein [Desulfuromonadaceae bacterium]|nr:glycine betaine ABC transporter substrate-binding protein [Desulfuromonadaceae bacterium]MDD2856168.1 glycine betaine ABC transporter substrate-binding protein [Desulfuromonadaceae bacterium]
MIRFTSFIVALLLVVTSNISTACVGKTIHIAISSPNEKLIAEMASLMISERTGSTVKIDVYDDTKSLYDAVKQGNVNILLENTDNASVVLGQPKGTPAMTLDAIKSEYRKTYNLTWLTPFGVSPQYAHVLTSDTLANYPALPKLLNKLSGVLAKDTYSKLLKSVSSDDKTKKTAKDFLKGKKLI